jgi:CheY-like chemotaxis protein/HD-like signal output (HDOD) protein
MKGDPDEMQKLGDEVFRVGQSEQTRRIVEALRDDRAPMQTLEATLAAEPVFTAHLLTLINFAAGLSQPLLSLAQALGVFGLDHIKPLALALLAFDLKGPLVADENDRARQIELCGLWEHSLGSAVIASRIAAEASELPLHAFTAGFIHDIGRVLLWRYSPQAFNEAQLIAQEQKIALRDAEKAAYGLDHVSVATDWCRRFDLSMQLHDILRLHHESLAAVRLVTSARAWKTIALVQAAESACSRHAIGAGGETFSESSEPVEPWSALALREVDWFDRCAAAKHEIEAAREMFGFVRASADASRLRQARRPEWAQEKKTPVPQRKGAARGGRGQVIRLPIAQPPPSAFEEKTPPARKLVLLVVEDHGSLCDMVSLFLMRHGYHVRTAGNGESALEILARETIHLVLLDLMLPKLDGFQVLRQMHATQRERFPYVIVVSAGASEMDRKKVLDLGANEYLSKPFHLNRLLERVQAVEKFLY